MSITRLYKKLKFDQVPSTPVGPTNLYDGNDAATAGGGLTVASGWYDTYSHGTFSALPDGEGGNCIRLTAVNSSNCRATYIVALESGKTYDFNIRIREGVGAAGRIITPRQTNGGSSYGSLSSQPNTTTSWNTYNLTLTVPSTGDYRIWFNMTGVTTGEYIEISNLEIFEQ